MVAFPETGSWKGEQVFAESALGPVQRGAVLAVRVEKHQLDVCVWQAECELAAMFAARRGSHVKREGPRGWPRAEPWGAVSHLSPPALAVSHLSPPAWVTAVADSPPLVSCTVFSSRKLEIGSDKSVLCSPSGVGGLAGWRLGWRAGHMSRFQGAPAILHPQGL